MGGLDFAGGTPVHIASGTAALAYSMMLGKRRGHGTHELNYRPHNVTHIVIGTVFLWVGWFGFNAGSALSANMRAVMAAVVTNLAACVGGITWCVLDYRLERKWSTVGFCSGVVAGLVAITPGSGMSPPLLPPLPKLTLPRLRPRLVRRRLRRPRRLLRQLRH
jgi:Amt family ammonium transporter